MKSSFHIFLFPQVLLVKKEVNPVELDFLLRFPFKAGIASPVDFLLSQGWGGIKVCVKYLFQSFFASQGSSSQKCRIQSTVHD